MTVSKSRNSLQSVVINEVGGRDVLENYKRVSTYRNLLPLIHIWPSIILAFILSTKAFELEYHLFSLLALIAFSIFVATRINALSVFVHEGSHFLVFPNKRINDIIVNLFAAFWILNDVGSYRGVHLKHHLYLLRPEDPDISLYSLDKNKSGLIFKFIKDLFFLSAFSRIIQYMKLSPPNNGSMKRDKHIKFSFLFPIAKITFQIFLFLIFVMLMDLKFLPSFILFVAMWVIPLFGIFPMLTRVKTLSEHLPLLAGLEYQKCNFVSRSTFLANSPFLSSLQTYLLGCGMDYHFEHHLFPDIPWYNLRKIHMILLNSSQFSKKSSLSCFLNRSYAGFLTLYFTRLGINKQRRCHGNV